MDITNTVNFKEQTGKEKLRPPLLDINKEKETPDFIEYKIITYNINKDTNNNDFLDNIDSFIYCDNIFRIKVPKKKMMMKNKKKKYAYVMSIFPDPKTNQPTYLDGCILSALGLRKQNTHADIICMVTPDMKKNTIDKLNIVFDKVIKTPYIAPYDKGYNTIMMDPKLFEKCNYNINHPFNYVFHKIHIFNPEYFPYEKVCYVDSDLVPINYYDSLFTLDTPAGWLEYRKKKPYIDSHVWDRCDFVSHGKLIPKILTDIDTKVGADINAGLLLISPNQEEYDEMIDELTSPIENWMGKIHKGFFNIDGFKKNTYCFPEQNYLTKRYSGKWHYIEFAFASWSLDPCNSMGIHMAAFNPKPWMKQPAGLQLRIHKGDKPYQIIKEKDKIPLIIGDGDDPNKNYANISFSYEIFNEFVIWGYLKYPKLVKFLFNETEIHGVKISYNRNEFKKLSNKKNIQFKKLKNFKVNEDLFYKLSNSQKILIQLIKNYNNYKKKYIKNYPDICKSIQKIKKTKKK